MDKNMKQNMKSSHSKYRNAGIIFELLVRQVTSDVMEGESKSAALQLMQKYFNPRTELGKELALYRSFFTTNNLTETKAFKFVDLIITQRKKLNNIKLREEKYALIREIKDKYDLSKFLSAKIPEYKVFASIYKTFLSETSNFQSNNVDDIINARFTISEYIMRSPRQKDQRDSLVEEFKVQNEDLRLLSYKILIDKFNKKYQDLGDDQKNLLREYINTISDSNGFREYVNKEVIKIKKKLEEQILKVDDTVTKIKLTEVKSQLDTIGKGRSVKDSQITALIVAMQIIEELKNV